MEDHDEFITPDMSSPIDVDAHVALVPTGATVKGMQFQALLDECTRRGQPIPGRRYLGFRDYPGTELVELLVLAAERLWPDVPLREGLRRVGRIAYPTLRESLLGRVIFKAVGTDIPRLWTLLEKGYALSASSGRARVLESRDNEVVVRLEDMYSFIDAWHVGILEGAVLTYGSEPRVRMRKLGPMAADFMVAWTPVPAS